MTSLKTIFINVNSVVSRQKRHYLQLFVEEHRPDVLLIAEHRLEARHTFGLKGYTVYRQDRTDRQGGGTAVCLTDRLVGERLTTDFEDIEGTVVRVRGPGGRHVLFMSLYLRPKDTLIERDLDMIWSMIGTDEAVIGADLNAKHIDWGGSIINTSGRNLNRWLLMHPSIIVRPTREATRCTATSASYIDIFMTTIGLTEMTGLDDRLDTLGYDSDHKAVLLEIVTGRLERRTVKEIYNFRSMNINIFNREMVRNQHRYSLPRDINATIEEIDMAVDGLTESINEAMNISIRKSRMRKEFLPELPSDILDLIRQKKILRRRMYRIVDPDQYRIIKAEVRNLDHIIKERIVIFERTYYLNFLRGIRRDRDMFRKVKRFCGATGRRDMGDLIDSQGRRLMAEDEKSELLATKFASIQSSSNIIVENQVSDTAHAPMVQFGTTYFADGSAEIGSQRLPIDLVKAHEVGMALRRLNNKKSSGEDGIPNYVLKRIDHRMWGYIAVLLNHCINVGYFPRKWKSSRVVPILKPGKDPTDPGGYRPISLLPCIGKAFEVIILSRLNDYMETENTLKNCQFGFRRSTSTTHALMVLVDKVSRGLQNRSATIAVSLDFRKAFDTVWQQGICMKMRTYGFNEYAVRLIEHYLKERTFRVSLGETFSEHRDVVAGVPQGSVLGPVLYNLYLSDIPQPNDGQLLLIYADDILVASTHPRAKIAEKRLQDFLFVLQEYFDRWKLVLNVEKCRSMVFRGKKRLLYRNARSYVPSLRIANGTIENGNTLQYLGIIFQEDMSYTRHVDNALKKGRAAFHALYKAMAGRNGLDPSIKLTIYKQIVRPTVAYAFTVWFMISSHQMERIRVMERKILSFCLGFRRRMMPNGTYVRPSNRSIYDGSSIKRIDSFMVDTALAQLAKCSTHPNDMVRQCSVSQEDFERLVALEGRLTPVCLLNLHNSNMLHDSLGRLIFYHRRFGSLSPDTPVYSIEQ